MKAKNIVLFAFVLGIFDFQISTASNQMVDLKIEVVQQNLLSEYESKLKITDKKISDIKKSITEANMSNLDIKMKLGEVENSRNRIQSLIDQIKKTTGSNSQTDYDALQKEFELNQQLIDQLSDLLK
jgi:phenylacetate-coenzyme A ligase PaaK-like adenylate-forming protein